MTTFALSLPAFPEHIELPKWFTTLEHITIAAVGFYAVRKLAQGGVLRTITRFMRAAVPGVNALVESERKKEVDKAMENLFPPMEAEPMLAIPKEGLGFEKVLTTLTTLSANDLHGDEGTLFAYVYEPGAGHLAFMRSVSALFLHENALNPTVFPCLRKFETEVVRMAANMVNGDEDVCGQTTSGGTESILLAMKAYRDRDRKMNPNRSGKPEIILPRTAHPAFVKAAAYFDLEIVWAPCTEEWKVDVEAVRSLLTPNTICLVGSAPQYAHGVIDPIRQLAEIARERDIGLHVDACVGGFILPWIEKLGHSLPHWDFRVSGVTSISLDAHKYGYAMKGVSVLLWRDAERRKFQYFVMSDSPLGMMISPNIQGSRCGAPMATAWAMLVAFGEDGYLRIAKDIMDSAAIIKERVAEIDGLQIVADPLASIISIGSSDSKVDINAVADVMESEFSTKWHIERQQNPDCIHLSLMPPHIRVISDFCDDLSSAVTMVRENPSLSSSGTAAMYGGLKAVPDERIVDEFLLDVMSRIYQA